MNYKMIFRALLFLIFLNNHLSAQCSDFVRIDGKSFKCGGSVFFPVVANYATEVCHGTGTLALTTFPYHYPTRHHEFFLSNSFSVNATNHNDGYTVMLNDFKEIKHLGFNTVRVVGAPEYRTIGSFGLLPWNGPTNESISYTNTAHTDLLLDITGDILKAAKEAQLKVILLVEGLRDNGPPQSNYIAYLESLAARFKYDATLMAIDFTNEPDIHSPGYGYNKTSSCSITATWHNAVKNNSQILTTVGLLTKAVYSWDPNVLNVDFMSFHPYPKYEDEDLDDPTNDMPNVIKRMKSDFLWCTNNVSIPWMVGETSVSAHTAQAIPIDHDLDSNPTAVTLTLQADYLNETLNACRDYGGAGYSWWSYMDKGPNASVKEYLGIVECNEGINGTFSVGVSPKPCAAWVGSFNPTPSPTTVQPSNYYSYFAVGTNTNYMISGTVTAGGVAVKDAVVELYSPVSHTCSTTETFACTSGNSYTLGCGQVTTCPGTNVMVNCSGTVTKCADEGLGFTYTNAQGQFTVHPYQSVNTASLINIFGVYARIKVTGVDCSITTQTVPTTSTANATYTIGLTKISRPTDAVVAYSSQTVTGVSINTTAVSYMTFTNYVINSGTFTARAGSYINLKPGFTAKSGSSFSARIGAYHHDCGSLTSGGTAFRTFEPTVNPKILDSQSYLYPNPGEGIYNIKMDEENEYTVLIYNMYGALIKSDSFTGTESSINIAEVSQGLYVFNVLHKKRIINSWKVIKQ